MFTIVALCMFGFPLALLGVITLAALPFWRVTIPNVLTFVFGGFIGMLLGFNLARVAAQYVTDVARIRGEPSYGTMLGWAALALGAEFGGIAVMSVKAALMRKQPTIHRRESNSTSHD